MASAMCSINPMGCNNESWMAVFLTLCLLGSAAALSAYALLLCALVCLDFKLVVNVRYAWNDLCEKWAARMVPPPPKKKGKTSRRLVCVRSCAAGHHWDLLAIYLIWHILKAPGEQGHGCKPTLIYACECARTLRSEATFLESFIATWTHLQLFYSLRKQLLFFFKSWRTTGF